MRLAHALNNVMNITCCTLVVSMKIRLTNEKQNEKYRLYNKNNRCLTFIL